MRYRCDVGFDALLEQDTSGTRPERVCQNLAERWEAKSLHTGYVLSADCGLSPVATSPGRADTCSLFVSARLSLLLELDPEAELDLVLEGLEEAFRDAVYESVEDSEGLLAEELSLVPEEG